MSDISEKINRISYDASQAYLMTGRDLTDFIKSAASDYNLNSEETKRVCEKANQTVYLGLFKDPNVDRANILFKLADHAEIVVSASEKEKAMSDYTLTPEDYRAPVVEKQASAPVEASAAEIGAAKYDITQKLASVRDRLSSMKRAMETVKVASCREAELFAGKIHELGRTMVVNGESYGDIAKIACRVVSDKGFDYVKTATAIAHIGDAIAEEGLVVNTELTKVSSAPVLNHKHPMNVACLGYAGCIEKAAAASEFLTGVEAHIAHISNAMAELEQL